MSVVILAAAAALQAQPAPAPASSPAPAAEAAPAQGSSVTPYPAAYFAQYRPNTAFDMVARVPGFGLNEGANVRGFGGAAGNVLVDGVRPATKDESLQGYLGRIPAGNVERIDIIRGGAPGIDMQGRSLVANVIRKKGDTTRHVALLRLERWMEDTRVMPGWRYDLNHQSGERTFDLGLGRLLSYDDSTGVGPRVRRDAAGAVILDEIASNEDDGYGHYGRSNIKTPLFGGALRLNGSITENDTKREEHFQAAADRLDVTNDFGSLDGELGLNFTRDFGERWGVEFVGLQTLAEETFVSRGEGRANERFSQNTNFGERIGRIVLKHRRSPTLSFEAGAETAFNFLEGEASFESNGAPVELPFSNVRVEEDRNELFALANWRVMEQLRLEGGFRYETSTIRQIGQGARERSFQYPKPRLTATWTPSEGSSLRVRLEREVGQLDFGDFVSEANLTTGVVASGNPDLEPNKDWVYEVTGERRFWDTGAAVLTLRRRAITDVIDRIPVAEIDPVTDLPGETFEAPGNIGEGTSDELEVDLTLPLRRFGITGAEFRADLTWRKSEVTDPTTGELRRISGQRPDQIEFRYRHDLPSKNLVLNLTWFDGWRETYYNFNQVSRFRLGQYTEAEVQYKPRPQTTLFFSLANMSRFTFHRDRDVYEGRRDVSPLAFAEERSNRSQMRAIFRLRQEFGV
jgi:hypothetical protein